MITKRDRNYFTVAGGIAEVQPDLITVLADAAENVEELDESRAEQAKERAEKLLHETQSNENEKDALINALRRSTFRLEAIKKFKRSSKGSFKNR